MKLLAEITEAMVGAGEQGGMLLGSSYKLRKSARVMLLNEVGAVATQYLANMQYYKLPGGGVEEGESIEEALVREVREEVGCECVMGEAIGMVIEYRNQYPLLHISYCYSARVVGGMGATALEPRELEEGQQTLWLSPVEMLTKLTTDTPADYEGKFITARDRAFVKEFLIVLNQQK